MPGTPSMRDDGATVVVSQPFGRDGLIALAMLFGGFAALVGLLGAPSSFVVWLGVPVSVVVAGLGGLGLANFVRGRGDVCIDRAAASVSLGGRRVADLDDLVAVEGAVRMVMTAGAPRRRGRVILDFGHHRVLVADRIDGEGVVELSRRLAVALAVPVRGTDAD